MGNDESLPTVDVKMYLKGLTHALWCFISLGFQYRLVGSRPQKVLDLLVKLASNCSLLDFN